MAEDSDYSIVLKSYVDDEEISIRKYLKTFFSEDEDDLDEEEHKLRNLYLQRNYNEQEEDI